MAKCDQCKRKFKLRGKFTTYETPDYIRVIHPKHKTEGFIFCSKRCLYRWFAKDIITALLQATPKEI